MKNIYSNYVHNNFRYFNVLLISFFTLIGSYIYAADYYWVGGSGDWSDHANHWATTSGGAVFHPSVPSQFDNVIFDANSFTAAGQTVTVTFESFCNKFDSRDVIAGARFTSTRALHIYGGIEIDQNLIFSQSGNLTLYDGSIIVGNGDPTKIVEFTVNGAVNINNGILDVSDYSKFNHSGSFKIVVGNAEFGKHSTTTIRSLTLQAGSLIVADSTTFNGHHLHITGGPAIIGNNVNFYNYGEFRINSSYLGIGDNSTFRQDHHTLWVESGNLTIGENSSFFRYGGNTYVRNGDFIVGNNSSYTSQSHTQVNNGSFTVGSDATFRIQGGYNNQIWNGDFTLGTNTSYWSQGHTYIYTGTFNWDNSNPIENYGTIQLNSGDFHLTAGVSFKSTNSLRSLNGSLIVDDGVTAEIRGNVQLTNGTIDLHPSANLTWWADLYLRGTQYGQYDINSGGRDLKRIQFDGTNYNSEYNFTDDVKASSDGIFMYANKINFNGHGVDVLHFYSWTGGQVEMDLTGTDTVYVKSQFRMYPSSNTNLTLGSATIKWTGTNHFYFYAGYNNTYNDLYFEADNTGSSLIHFEGNTNTVRDVFIEAKGTQYLNMYSTFTFQNFNLEYLSNYTANPNLNFYGNWNVTGTFKVQSPSTIRNNINSYSNNTFNIFDVEHLNQWIVRANTTQTFTDLKPIIGSCDHTITIKGETLGQQGIFNMDSGTFNGDWLILQDMNATGTGSFIADNTVDLGNVSGWTVNTIAPRDFFWVGGSGNWDVASNWSDVSGGAPGNCGVPNRTDRAIFDANSFTASGQYVNINTTAEVKDMVWDNVTAGAGISGGHSMNIYGSLELDANMAFSHGGTFYFQSVNTGNTIRTNGVKMRQVIFSGQNQNTGEWTLLDDFNAQNNWVYVQRGKLNTNGNNIDVYGFHAWYNNPTKIDFGNSGTVKVKYQFLLYPSYTVTNSDSLDIVFESTSHFYFYGGNHTYRDITFNALNTGGSYIEMQGNNTIRDVKMEAYGAQYIRVYHSSTFRDFEFNYYKDYPWNQQLQFWHSTYRSMTINGFGKNKPWVYFHGNNTLGDVSFSNLRGLYFGGLQTMTSFAPLSGSCDQLIQFWGGNGVSMSSGTFEIDWVTMWNLTASGGATFNANNVLGTSYNLNGWNIDTIPPTNFYWVGGSGNWNDPNHWSYTSGGAPGVCPVPGRFDNVFFDVNSFTAPNQYVNLNTTAEFNNMLWTNVNFPRLIGGGQMNVYGSFQLDEKITYQATGWVYFRSRDVGNVIKTAGKKLYYVRFDGEGQSTGEWTLKDDLELHYDLYIDRGTFISDSSNISSRIFYCWTGSPTTIDLTGTEYVNVTNQFRVYPNNFNLIMDKADIRFTGTNHFYFIGGNNTFNDIEMTASNSGNSYIEFQYNNTIDNVKITANGYQNIRFYHNSTFNDIDIEYQNPSNNIPNVYIEGSNVINDLSITSIGNAGPYIYINNSNTFNNLVTAGVGTRLYPRGNTTQTVNDALAIGSGGFPVFFQSQNQGTTATIYKPSGTVCLDYVWMRDIIALSDLDSLGSPKTEFYAGNNSVDLGNNSNWEFSSCDGFYWVGGTGNWSDQNHWATSSGGTQLHTTLPTQFDNVFFDANSFTTAGEVVTVDIADPRANNMSWSSSLFTPTFAGSGVVNVYGSLRFISNMNMNFSGDFNFKSDTSGNEINTGGHTLANVNFIGGNDGEGAWELVNHLDVSNSINLSNGSFITNDKDIFTKEFNSTSINTRSLSLGASTLTINDGQWNPSGTNNLTFDKGTSTIIITGTDNSDFFGSGLDYHNVTFNTPEALTSKLTESNTFNTLRFDAGVEVTLDDVIQEAQQIKAIGSCARNVTLVSSTPGSAATLKQTAGNVDGKFLTLQDNTATGGASFSANLSNDEGNVNGWSFTSAPVISIIEETGLVDCELNNDGWAKVTVTAGTPPFSYLWSTSETTPQISGLIPGTYYVTVTDSVGCSLTEAIDVLNKPSALDPIGFAVSDDQICLGTEIEFTADEVISNALQFDGSDDYADIGNQSDLSPTGVHPITFEAWINPASAGNGIIASKYDNGNAGNSNFFVGLSNGKLIVSANGTDDLTSSANISSSNWTHIAVAFENGPGKTIIYINGVYDNSGTLTYNASNGNANFVLGTIASGTLSDHYYNGKLDEVRVWDSVRSESDIFENLTLPQDLAQTNLMAYYRLDELTGSTTAVDKSLNGYDATLTNMDVSAVWTDPGAFTPTVTYTWDFGDFSDGAGQSINHTYSNPGTYIVSLYTSDETGCPNIVKDTILVSQVAASIEFEGVQCFGENNGSIVVTADGGVAPYNFSIDGGTTFHASGIFTNLQAGTYSVIVKDAIYCETTAQNVVINQPSSALEFTTIHDDVVCADDEDGSITILATGGSPPYQYSLNGGISYQASNLFSDLLPGGYSIKVRDSNNCSPDVQIVNILRNDTIPPTINCPADMVVDDPLMNGCAVAVNYALPTGSDNCELVSIELADGLASGELFPVGINTVTYTATDASGNTSSCSFTITVVDAQAPRAICKDINLYLDASGNTILSADAINDGSYDNCDSVFLVINVSEFDCNDLGANSVVLTVTDASNNSASCTATVTVLDTIAPIAAANDISINLVDRNGLNLTQANIDAMAAGGSDNCSFTYEYTSGQSFYDCNDVGNTYPIILTFTDNSGNTSTSKAYVTVTDTLSVCNDPPVAVAQNFQIATGENCDAIITVEDIDAGSYDPDGDDLTFELDNYGPFGVGTHTVTLTVSDYEYSDSSTITVTVVDQTPPSISLQNLIVQLDASGSASITAAQIDNGSSDACGIFSMTVLPNTFDCSNLGLNIVMFTVTDVNGNVSVAPAEVTVVDVIKPTMTCISGEQYRNPNYDGCSYVEVNGEFTPINLDDNCSVSDLNYTLSGATSGSGNSLTGVVFNLGVTIVSWTITDSSGNQTHCSFDVNVENNLSTTISSPTFAGGYNISCNGSNDGYVDLTVSGGTEPYTYLWSNGAPTQDLEVVPAGTYDVFVTDVYGCPIETSIVLTEPDPLLSDAGSDLEICFGSNTIIGGSSYGGVGPYTYQWEPATDLSGPNSQNPVANPTVSTIYTLTVTDQNGCVDVSSMMLTVHPLPVASIETSTADDFCNGVTLTALSSTTENQYAWSRGDFTQSIFLNNSIDPAGLYSVFVTDLNGCTSAVAAEYNFEPENLTSSYTILGFKEVKLGESNIVESGSVGLTGENRTIHIKKGTRINSPGSFVKGDKIKDYKNTNILNKIYDPVVTTLPTMYYNTTTGISGKTKVGKNTSSTISAEYINIEIQENATVTITGSVYGEIKIGKGSTVTFTSSSLDLRKLKTEDNKSYQSTTVNFSGDAQLRVKEKVEIGKYTTLNPHNYNVVFYIGEDQNRHSYQSQGNDDDDEDENYRENVRKNKKGKGGDDDDKLESKGNQEEDDDDDDNDDDKHGHKGELRVKAQGTVFNASAYLPHGHIHVHDNHKATEPGRMTGQFIAEKIHSSGKFIIWNWHDCDNSLVSQSFFSGNEDLDDSLLDDDINVYKVYPVPNYGLFTAYIDSPVEDYYTIFVYNLVGAKVYEKRDLEVNGSTEIEINLQDHKPGYYYVVFVNDDQVVTRKVLIVD